MTKITVAASLLALVAVGCAIVTPLDDTAVVVTNVSNELFPGFDLGADEASVRQLFGEPDFVLQGDFAGFEYWYSEDPSAVPTNVGIMFSENFENRAVSIHVQSPFPQITHTGIRIGSSGADVASVFGMPDETDVRASWGTFGGRFTGDVYFGRGNEAMNFGYDSTGHVDRIDFFLTEITQKE